MSVRPQIQLPPAKSEAIRLLALAFLEAVHQHKASLGVEMQLDWPEDIMVMHDALSGLLVGQSTIHLKEAGTPARIVVALAASFAQQKTTFTAAPSLEKRPMNELLDVLHTWGANISSGKSPHGWPIQIEPAKLQLVPVSMAMGRSSQFASALALLAFGLQQPLSITWNDQAVSLPYLQLTLALLQARGAKISLQVQQLQVNPGTNFSLNAPIIWENDWSSAVFFAVGRMLLPRVEDVILEGLSINSRHPDRKILDLLADFGLKAVQEGYNLRLTRNGVPFQVKKNYWLKDCPDLVPAWAVFLALTADRPVRLFGVGHLAHKESNRLDTLNLNLQALGSALKPEGDDAWLYPRSGPLPQSFNIQTAHDHRMLMAFAPLSLLGVKVSADDFECVRKSFPFFHREWAKLCPQWLATPSE